MSISKFGFYFPTSYHIHGSLAQHNWIHPKHQNLDENDFETWFYMSCAEDCTMT